MYLCTMNVYEELVGYLLPQEIFESFEVVKTTSEKVRDEEILHIFLEERNRPPQASVPLRPNGFSEESQMEDFPVRDRKVILHLRKRRWKDAEGNSYSNDWQLVAKGTRMTNTFAAFLKE